MTERIALVTAETAVDLSVPPFQLHRWLGGSWFQLPNLTARLRDSFASMVRL